MSENAILLDGLVSAVCLVTSEMPAGNGVRISGLKAAGPTRPFAESL